VFVTGLNCVPALGFSPTLCIQFGQRDADDPTKDYPVANVCSHTLRLPVLKSYQAFKKNMNAALEMPVTFSRE